MGTLQPVEARFEVDDRLGIPLQIGRDHPQGSREKRVEHQRQRIRRSTRGEIAPPTSAGTGATRRSRASEASSHDNRSSRTFPD
jgi:hypothetical protein